jgi:predicted SPOUT superfamily RNA methylase MTH1
VYVGLDRDCRVEKKLPEGVRVTVKFDDPSPEYVLKPKGKLRGTAVSPNLPRTEAGLYWGYTVRIANSLSKVFTEIPFRGVKSYDVTIGTSEKGSPVHELCLPKQGKDSNHILIVFGGVEGLEYALENDETLMEDDVSALFDHYVNTCPNQGSRTIRSEEAILITMSSMSPIIQSSLTPEK